jgi:hypothetical protein
MLAWPSGQMHLLNTDNPIQLRACGMLCLRRLMADVVVQLAGNAQFSC